MKQCCIRRGSTTLQTASALAWCRPTKYKARRTLFAMRCCSLLISWKLGCPEEQRYHSRPHAAKPRKRLHHHRQTKGRSRCISIHLYLTATTIHWKLLDFTATLLMPARPFGGIRRLSQDRIGNSRSAKR